MFASPADASALRRPSRDAEEPEAWHGFAAHFPGLFADASGEDGHVEAAERDGHRRELTGEAMDVDVESERRTLLAAGARR